MERSLPWWVSQILFTLIALFFILFGINLLYMAYQTEDPFSFILTFFASNLIILIAAALLLGFILKMLATLRKTKEK